MGHERREVKLKKFNVKADGKTNNLHALRSAFASGERLEAEPGLIIFKDEGIEIPDWLNFCGAGGAYWSNFGTVLQYIGDGDAFKINAPISTPTNISSRATGIVLRDFTIQLKNPSAECVGLAARGPTFLQMERLTVDGARYGVVLDQVEVSELKQVRVRGGSQGDTAVGVWIPNGGDFSPGGHIHMANRITLDNCNFDVTDIGIADDGGLSHDITRCNFNRSAVQIRACDVHSLHIYRNFMEGSSQHAIELTNTRRLGGESGLCQQVKLELNTLISQSTNALLKGAAENLVLELNTFNNQNPDGIPAELEGEWFARWNKQVGYGPAVAFNNL